MKPTIIKDIKVYRSSVTGLNDDEMGSGLAIQTDPPLETLNSYQVVRIAEAIKKAVNKIMLEVE